MTASKDNVKHFIGVDTYDKNNPAYCLARVQSGKEVNADILLCKTMTDPVAFDEEVKNLSKYFNAQIIVESHHVKKHAEEGDGSFIHLLRSLSINISKGESDIPKHYP